MSARWLRVALLAGTGAAAMALSAALTASDAFADSTDLVMGGSGMPIPPQVYIDDVNDLYLHCATACSLQSLATPEGLYPIIGPKELPFDTSVTQGVTILNNAIKDQLADGNTVTALGYSQSATIDTIEMENIANGTAGIHPDPDQLKFVLLGDPNNPNGGMLERFDLPALGANPSIPSLGITFSGATPVTEYPTDIYTGEYDGFADYPRYPLNLLSDLNALLGILFVHTQYPNMDLSTAEEIGQAGATTYHMVPTDHLPLLDLVRSIPAVGPVVSDLLEPDLRVLVNLGYGDPDYGWSTSAPDVPTPLGLFPSLADFEKVPGLLVSGTEQGIADAVKDVVGYLQDPASVFSLADNPLVNLLQTPFIVAVAAEDISFPPPGVSLDSLVNAVSAAASAGYASLLPLADIANAMVTTLPALDVTGIVNELAAGDLLDAIGLPIAADVGILPVAGFFALASVGEGALFAAGDLLSPFIDIAGLL
ncbi:PE-PPE domain-containing protein [Mycobacterium eburneum]|nr:PE-PPE domain-containing protein [Mycobacterium eburneum]TDH50742.1 PE-PPE domain-containing protein [Mycobacterium eburneum]